MTKSLTSYDILNVSDQASQADIHAAYRALAKSWHPDRHQGIERERANHNFKLLQQAYETVKTPAMRSQYNIMLARQKRAIMVNQNKVINDNHTVKGFFRTLEGLFASPSDKKRV